MIPMTYSFTGWLPNGFKVTCVMSLEDKFEAVSEAVAITNKMMADGFTLEAPGLEAGEEIETIVTVMRRAKGDGTPIIDFYPEWGAGKDEPYGTYKYLHKYMNDEAEIAEFLQVAGFKSLEAIPLYDGQAPLKRTQGKPHAKETAVRAPFKLVRKQGAEKTGSDGKPYRPWEFVRYEANAGSGGAGSQSNSKSPENGIVGGNSGTSDWTPETINKLIAMHQSTPDELKAALGIQGRWGEWNKGYKAAEKALEDYRTEPDKEVVF